MCVKHLEYINIGLDGIRVQNKTTSKKYQEYMVIFSHTWRSHLSFQQTAFFLEYLF